MSETCSFTISPDAVGERAGEEGTPEPGGGLSDVWSCPHEAHPESDTCVFHTPPERRAELGIDDASVRDALLAAVRDGGERAKQFLGAHFGDLDLSSRVIGADDRFPVDLRHATVEGELDLSNASVRQPVALAGAEIGAIDARDAAFEWRVSVTAAGLAGVADFRRAAFDRRAGFDGASFGGVARFRSASFGARTSFETATFEQGGGFAEATFDGDVAFDRATFGGPATFERVQFDRTTTFTDARFAGTVDFERGTARGDVRFEDTAFRAGAVFDELECDGDAVFAGATFGDTVSFAGAEFRGGSNLLVDDADFSGVTFEADVDFSMARLRYAGFRGAEVAGEADFGEADFLRGATFEGAAFESRAVFADAGFYGQVSFEATAFGAAVFAEAVFDEDAVFAAASFEGDVSFAGVEFRGGANVAVDDADFSKVRFAADADFEHASFRFGRFDEATVAGRLDLSATTFDRGASLRALTCEGRLDCYRSRFDGQTTVADGSLAGATFDETVFDDDVSFADVTATGPVSFRGAEFRGGANVTVDDADFTGARFEAAVSFEDGRFRYGRFDGATFAAEPQFDSAQFRKGASFVDTRLPERASFDGAYVAAGFDFEPVAGGQETLVSCRDADIARGRITQPADSDVYYDFTDATVGRVRLDAAAATGGLFDYFLFHNTAFDEFDFSRHREYLERNDWEIHRLAAGFEGESGTSALDDDAVGGDGGVAFDPADLEATYLKAKNGAAAVGDNKAASEFFIKELTYRRHQYTAILTDTDGAGALSRTEAAGRWFMNAFFSVTCGYGERPSKVVGTSALIIGALAVPYAVLGIDMPRGEFADPLVYSLQAFTSLVLDPPKGSNAIVNTLTALEGFVGAFFIALFVFSLTRSLHR